MVIFVSVVEKVPVSRNQVLAGGGDLVAEYPKVEELAATVHVELEMLDALASTNIHALSVPPAAFIDPNPEQSSAVMYE